MATKAQRSVFRHVLQQLRADAGMSQRELANRVSVSAGAVAQWETGESAPREDTALALEDAFDLTRGHLGGLLGYAASSPAVDRALVSVAAAIEADADLGDRDRRLLMTLYRELTRSTD